MKCEYYHCKNCPKNNNCILQMPTNKEHLLLNQEIDYWLNELNKAKRRIKEYGKIFEDIKNHRYAYAVNVYGNIQYAPRQNALGVSIRRPEHVAYGWNINKLEKIRDDIVEHIKELRMMEFEMRKELMNNDRI